MWIKRLTHISANHFGLKIMGFSLLWLSVGLLCKTFDYTVPTMFSAPHWESTATLRLKGRVSPAHTHRHFELDGLSDKKSIWPICRIFWSAQKIQRKIPIFWYSVQWRNRLTLKQTILEHFFFAFEMNLKLATDSALHLQYLSNN